MEIYGSATTININRASSSFRHTITYSFNGLIGTIATKTSSTSIGWTIPTSFYAKIPNAKSGKVTIKCDTYSGNTNVGSKSTTANVFVINSNPTVDATIKDVNTTTVALTGDENKMVKYFSNAKVDITATAKNSATIKSRKVVCGNKTGTSTSNTLNKVESGSFVVSCTDSRGFSASKTISKTLVNYIKLAFTNMSLERPTTTSSTVNAVIKGNYFNGNFGAVSNTFAMKFRYKENGGEWSTYTTLTPTINENIFTLSISLGNIYDFNKQYEFEFNIVDKLMNVTQGFTVTRGIPIVDIGENDVKVNGKLFNNNQKILWEGAKFMNENQTIDLSEPVSAQANGIVLVFSGYDPDTDEVKDFNWSNFFIPKEWVEIVTELNLGKGNFFVLGGSEGIIGYKYISIRDNNLQGANCNDDVTDTYNNTKFVLRYVLSV